MPQVVAPAVAHASSGHLVSSRLGDGDHRGGRRGQLDPVKVKIVSHPRYDRLLAAFLDCQKLVCPAERAQDIAAAAREQEARQRVAASDVPAGPDPELDQFMEAYCKLLVEWKEELGRPLREAKEFMRIVKSQLSSINPAGPPLASLISAEDEEEEEEGGGMEMEAEESVGIDPRSDDKELKRNLLKKYNGYLGSLRKGLSRKKKKKGKLPKEARQKLLSWWQLHYRWPYPSEMEKIALAESTGLEQKQINNWFINQRKRHWKTSDEMQFTVMDSWRPTTTHRTPPLRCTSTPASWEQRRR